MLHVLRRLVRNKYFWILSIIFYFLFAVYNMQRKAVVSNSVEECILLSIDDHLMLLVLFSIFPICVSSGIGIISANDLHVISRTSNKSSWYGGCIVQIIVIAIIETLLYLIFCYLSGMAKNMNILSTWDSSNFRYQGLLNPDSFDSFGQPLQYAINNNISPIDTVLQAALLLMLRSTGFISVCWLISSLVQRRWAGIVITILLSWLDIYFYNIFRLPKLYVLPHEYSIATTINGRTLPIMISVFYWMVLCSGIQLIGYMNNDRIIETATCYRSKVKATGEVNNG